MFICSLAPVHLTPSQLLNSSRYPYQHVILLWFKIETPPRLKQQESEGCSFYESQLAGSLLSANEVSIRGSGGRACPSEPKSRYYLGGRVCFGSVLPGHVPCGKRVTVGYRFPLGPHFGEPFGVLGGGADVCEKGEGVLAQIGQVRVKAPFASAVDVGGGRPKVARREGLCRGL